MKNQVYSMYSRKDDEHESAKKMLKRLRVLLILWLVIFVVTMIWFSLSPSSF